MPLAAPLLEKFACTPTIYLSCIWSIPPNHRLDIMSASSVLQQATLLHPKHMTHAMHGAAKAGVK
jgi:hypothetical protein